MFFKQRVNDDASISYFFGCGGHGKAVAVDVVAGDEAWYMEQARKLNVKITTIFDTHIHADHLSGGRALADLADAAYVLHESNQGRTGYAFTPVWDQEVISAGNTHIQVLHTPGHTEDSICLLVSDFRRSQAPWFVITGDTLFVGSVGRPDLAGRETEMAALLWQSLHNQLLTLPDDLEIFPGHQAGSSCGADISGKPSSTIGFEKRWNKLLSLSKEEFNTTVVQSIPPRPSDMNRIVAFNLGTLHSSGATLMIDSNKSNPRKIAPIDAARLSQGEAVIFDVREPNEYAAEHISGAHSLCLSESNFVQPAAGKTAILYCNTGRRSCIAAEQLMQAGFDNVAVIEGGIIGWKAAALPTDNEDSQ